MDASHLELAALDAASPQGRIVGARYRIEARLGLGGAGAVYRGVDLRLVRPVAIKLLHPHLCQDEASVARFRREALAAARTGNRHIVQVFDSGRTEGGAEYIVMEALEGEELSRIVEREAPLTVERAVRIAVQIADALMAAHAHGIVHRDLKPENVLVVRNAAGEENVKVVDFGISKFDDAVDGRPPITRLGETLGTPAYMAPEAVMGEPSIDGRADLYALGVMIHELLTGRLPITGATQRELMHRTLVAAPASIRDAREDVPDALCALVARLLEKAPEARPRDAREVFDALANHLTPMVVREVRLSDRPRPLPPSSLLVASGEGALDPETFMRPALSKRAVLGAAFFLALVTGAAFGMSRAGSARARAIPHEEARAAVAAPPRAPSSTRASDVEPPGEPASPAPTASSVRGATRARTRSRAPIADESGTEAAPMVEPPQTDIVEMPPTSTTESTLLPTPARTRNPFEYAQP